MYTIKQIEIFYPNRVETKVVGRDCIAIYTDEETKTATIEYTENTKCILVNVPFILGYKKE